MNVFTLVFARNLLVSTSLGLCLLSSFSYEALGVTDREEASLLQRRAPSLVPVSDGSEEEALPGSQGSKPEKEDGEVKEKAAKGDFQIFPDEVTGHIISFLSLKEKARVREVSKYFNWIAADQIGQQHNISIDTLSAKQQMALTDLTESHASFFPALHPILYLDYFYNLRGDGWEAPWYQSLSEEKASIFFQNLKKNEKIKEIVVTFNVTPSSMYGIIRTFGTTPIKSLSLTTRFVDELIPGNDSMNGRSFSDLWQALRDKKVQALNFFQSYMGNAGATALARRLPCFDVETLVLRNTEIGDEGAIELAKSFQDENGRVKTLDLLGNQITLQGAISFVQSLPAENQVPQVTIETVSMILNPFIAENIEKNEEKGFFELAEQLQGKKVKNFYLWDPLEVKSGSDKGFAKRLKAQYPHINWIGFVKTYSY